MKRTQSFAVRASVISCVTVLAALLFAPLAKAQITWDSHATSTQCFFPDGQGGGAFAPYDPIDLYGFGACQPAVDAAQAKVDQFYATCPPGDVVLRDCAPYPTPNNFVCFAGQTSRGGACPPTGRP